MRNDPTAATSGRRASGRAGRRGGPSTSREEILSAARSRFAGQGYGATTIRQIAADAGVDPALVHYFFKTKDGLFAAVMDVPYSPAEYLAPAFAPGLQGAGERLVRRFLEFWEDPETQAGMLTLIRSATARPEAAELLRDFIARELQPRIAKAIGRPDGDLRAVLVGSTVMGIVVERYVLKVEPLASADPEDVVAWIGPTVQRYLSGDPPEPRRA